jgi:hypothetical protein
MSSIGAALGAALSPLRAEASRKNGAKSCGPKTPEGKARSAQNALKHGLRSQKHVVLPGESAAEFEALEAAIIEELAPQGALQAVLARRVVAAAWRLERAERIEAGLFEHCLRGDRNLGVALIRDGNGPRAFDTLLRYRGTTLAELWRALRTLKALQAEAAARQQPAVAPEPRLLPEPRELPIEPERRGNPCDSGRPDDRTDASKGDQDAASASFPPRPLPTLSAAGPLAQPIEPEMRRKPTESAPSCIATEIAARAAALLAGTALAPLGRRR